MSQPFSRVEGQVPQELSMAITTAGLIWAA